jgi:predicted dehydrogenase
MISVTAHRQLSLGLCGLDRHWERSYRPALGRLGARARVDAVAGWSWNEMSAAAKMLDARHAGSVRELMRRASDGVIVAAPGWQRWFPLRAAIAARRSVYVALPASFEPDALAELHAAAQDAGVLVMPELRLRYTPATLRLWELLATELGPVREIEVRALAPGISGWRVEMQLIDWCRALLGRVPRTVACTEEAGSGSTRPRTIRVGFEAPGGRGESVTARIVLSVSLVGETCGDAADEWPLEFSVRGRHGEARLEDAAQLRWRLGGVERSESLSADRAAVSVAIDHFARRLAGGLIPVPDLGDVARAAHVARLAELSREQQGAELSCAAG